MAHLRYFLVLLTREILAPTSPVQKGKKVGVISGAHRSTASFLAVSCEHAYVECANVRQGTTQAHLCQAPRMDINRNNTQTFASRFEIYFWYFFPPTLLLSASLTPRPQSASLGR